MNNNTTELFEEKLKQIPYNELVEMAEKELQKLCKTYGKSFKMSVPPQTTDTDMIFVELIRRFKLTLQP